MLNINERSYESMVLRSTTANANPFFECFFFRTFLIYVNYMHNGLYVTYVSMYGSFKRSHSYTFDCTFFFCSYLKCLYRTQHHRIENWHLITQTHDMTIHFNIISSIRYCISFRFCMYWKPLNVHTMIYDVCVPLEVKYEIK